MSTTRSRRDGAMRSRHYPTTWQRRTMWTALTTLFLVFLTLVIGTVLWLGAKLVGFLQPILIPVAIAIIVAYLLDPVVTWMTSRGMERTRSILLLFAVASLALTAVMTWLGPVIWMQTANAAKELPEWTRRVRDSAVTLIYRYDRSFGVLGDAKGKDTSATSGIVNWFLGAPTPTPRPAAAPEPSPAADPAGVIPPASREVIAPNPNSISVADRQRIQDWVEKQMPNLERQLPAIGAKTWEILKTSIGGFLGFTGFLFSLIMVPIYLFFLLKERPAIQQRWKEYLPLRSSPLKDEVAAVLLQINNYIIAYFRGQLLVCVIDGLLIGLALYLVGLPFAPLIGCLVVVLTMIPYIGIILCWIPAVLIAFVHSGDFWLPFWVTIIFLIVQNLEGFLIAPRIVGNSVGLHPMTVIVSIFVWGILIGGLLGPILAVPLTATIKVLLARYVWGARLREEIIEEVEEIPVVEQAQEAARA